MPLQLRFWGLQYDTDSFLRSNSDSGRRKERLFRYAACAASLCFLGLSGALLQQHFRDVRLSSTSRSPEFSVAPAAFVEPQKPKGEIVAEHKVDSRVLRAGQDVWRVEIWSPSHEKDDILAEEYVKIFKNEQLVRKYRAEELSGVTLEFGKAAFTPRFPLLILRGEPAAGHPGPINLFSIREGKLVAMGKVEGEAGGPIFRDYDGDGKKEWVFDDYNWYVYYGARPRYFVVYKEQSDGTLKKWKKLPNKDRRRLPGNLGFERWE